MGLQLKWSVFTPSQQQAYCKASNFTDTNQRFMMSSASLRPVSRDSRITLSPFALLLRTFPLLFVVAVLCSKPPVCEAGEVPITRTQERYSGCNVINMYGTCQALHRPDFLNSIGGNSLRMQRDQCLPMLGFLRCAIFKMACRSGRSRNDLIVQVPCQVSCEQALNFCTQYVHDDAAWDHLRVSDCRFLPAGGCLDWRGSSRRRSSAVATHSNEFCRDSRPPCASMFPKRFRRRDWKKGNFSIAVDILIKSVMWFFQGSKVHSYLTAEVRRVFKSNIGLERGLQHTILWPSPCYCQGQILVGHRYYLLAHSIRNAHEFNVSVDSVFVPRVKRYRKRFMCWMNRICPRRKRRDRRRRRRRSLHNRWRYRRT